VRALVVAAIVFAASPARAASLPAHADVRVSGHMDAAAFERSAAQRYHIEFRKVVITDIDRDGDLDIVAATERGFSVWVNDGSGHLTSDTRRQAPAVDGRSPDNTWEGRTTEREEPMQNDAPSVPLLAPYGHAPPPIADSAAVSGDRTTLVDYRTGSSSPRAPPV
jgi:hypothetical protein